MPPILTLLQVPFLATVQDLGRVGFERLGVPVSGAMDSFVLRAANRLVGNPPGAAALELALAGIELALAQPGLVALAGPLWRMEVGGRSIPAWIAAYARAGERIRVYPSAGCAWGYLAFSGGVDVPLVMGSRSTYLRGGFGGFEGRPLRAGDCLALGSAISDPALLARAGVSLAPNLRPLYANPVTLRVLPAPQADVFDDSAWRTFLSSAYTLSPTSDRMGYRLEGAPIRSKTGAELLSEGVVMGALQVPGSGQPLVLMADRQTAGGYPKIAVVISADLPLLAQLPPGGQARFELTTLAEAQSAYRALLAGLEGV